MIPSSYRLALAFVAMTVAACAAGTEAAIAGFAPGSELLASEAVEVTAVDVDGQGTSFVAWDQDDDPGTVGNDAVKGRRVSAGGQLGPILDISVQGVKSIQPAVAFAPNGRLLVAWRHFATASSNSGVKARWVEADSSLGDIVTLAEGSASLDAVGLDVTIDSTGVATVVWRSQATPDRLQGRRIDQGNGLSALYTDLGVGGSGNGLRAVALPSGSTLLAWRSGGTTTNVLGADGAVGNPVTVSAGGLTSDPALAVDPQGNGLIVWRRSSGSDYAIVGRRIAPNGSAIATEFTIDPNGTHFVGPVASVAVDSFGRFLVGWDRQDAAGMAEAHVRRLDKELNFAGPAQTASTATAAGGVVLALDDRGTGVVGWNLNNSGGSLTQGRALDPFGVPDGGVEDLMPGGVGLTGGYEPPVGVAAFVSHIGGSLGTVRLNRYLVPPICSATQATVVQGNPIAAPLSCEGPAIESAQVVQPPQHGTTGDFDAAGLTIAYTPTPGYEGPDSFTYSAVNDGGSSEPAQVGIAVGRDSVAPVITHLRLRRSRGRSRRAVASRRHRRRVIKYRFAMRFSEAATARVAVARARRGVRRRGRCRPPRKRNRRGRRCVYYRRIGVVRSRTPARATRIWVRGRLRRRLLRGGRFRVRAVARDTAGNRSRPRRLNVRLKRLRPRRNRVR